MDRRKQAESEASEYSIAGSMKDLAISYFQYAKDCIMPEYYTSKELLSRLLSTKSYISTNSSLAKRPNAAQDDLALQRFEEIGKGQCGTVYCLTGKSIIVKVSNSAQKSRELFIDYQVHERIQYALDQVKASLSVEFSVEFSVPSLHTWISPGSEKFWADNMPLFPKKTVTEKFALVAERVFPVPLPVREALVDTLCPSAIKKRKQEFLAQPENKSCLIRIYLGRRETTRTKTNLQNLKLRNFPLHVNEMEEMDLDTKHFAEVMAQALAILHWKAGVDGNDIEFVLGSSPMRFQRPSLEVTLQSDMLTVAKHCQYDFGQRSTSIWIIDFNQCTEFQDDDTGLKQLVDAFFWNDPYYPRPNTGNHKDTDLWEIFSKQYLDISGKFTQSATPRRFIAQIESRCQKGTLDSLF
ncbi:zinc finger protein-domain-containing protein [Stachybotrys elegans]|uniref:Zinc finger protein-domain-containing protein n=1 Tax=Stachybotrys elegans TaxID=80388 RepID=A0A8K0T1B9_9HYPO|nr:zinc finger protein-domain-containing protein [Stachybotrys elegans]